MCACDTNVLRFRGPHAGLCMYGRASADRRHRLCAPPVTGLRNTRGLKVAIERFDSSANLWAVGRIVNRVGRLGMSISYGRARQTRCIGGYLPDAGVKQLFPPFKHTVETSVKHVRVCRHCVVMNPLIYQLFWRKGNEKCAPRGCFCCMTSVPSCVF
jgi:hypothetical protein